MTTDFTTEATPDQIARVDELREQLRAAGARFVAVAYTVQPAAQALADLEAELRAAEHVAGMPTTGLPPARELACDVLRHCAAALRPYVHFASQESAERSAAALTTAPSAPTAPETDEAAS